MIRILTTFALTVVFTTACIGEDENPLKGTPFEKEWGRMKQNYRNGNMSTKLQSENESSYFEYASKLSTTYIRLIEEFNLYDELKITKRQREELGETISPTSGSVAETLGDGTVIFNKQRKAFEQWLRGPWTKAMRRYQKQSNEAVAEILDDDQLERLKQIGFQFHAVGHSQAVAAYGFHEVKIKPAKTAKLVSEFRKAKESVELAKPHIAFREKWRIMAELVGVSKLEAATGELISFDPRFDPDSIADELNDVEADATQNPRRK